MINPNSAEALGDHYKSVTAAEGSLAHFRERLAAAKAAANDEAAPAAYTGTHRVTPTVPAAIKGNAARADFWMAVVFVLAVAGYFAGWL